MQEVAPCPTDQLALDDGAAIDCTLAAIVGGEVGQVSWAVRAQSGYSQEVSQSLVGDGTAYSWGRIQQDLDFEVPPAVHVGLESVDYFEGCTSEATPLERFVCLRGGQDVQLEVCADGFDSSDGA